MFIISVYGDNLNDYYIVRKLYHLQLISDVSFLPVVIVMLIPKLSIIYALELKYYVIHEITSLN